MKDYDLHGLFNLESIDCQQNTNLTNKCLKVLTCGFNNNFTDDVLKKLPYIKSITIIILYLLSWISK